MRLAHGQFIGTALDEVQGPRFSFREVSHHARVNVPRHSHMDAHVVLVVRGDYVSEARSATTFAGSPRLIVNPAGTTHRDRFQSATGLFFTMSVGPDAPVHPGLVSGLAGPLAFGPSWPASLATRMFREFRARDELSPLVLDAMAVELLASAVREIRPRWGKPPAWFARALDLIRERCCESLPIGQIAREVGVHPYHLARVARAFTGRNPGELLREYRTERAMQLLKAAGVSIGEVAMACGYSDQSQFTRSFRRMTGTTPGRFRRETSVQHGRG